MQFELITKENINKATEIQLKIFNDEKACAYLHYLNSFICKKDYYIVYKDNQPVGITGVYIDEFTQEDGVAWLGWFGVLTENRKKGIGHEIIMQTLKLAEEKGFHTLRLYTHKDNFLARKLYDKVMDFCEDYTQENVLETVIYSKSLKQNRSAEKFNNKFLNLKWHDLEQEEGYKLYTKQIIK